MAYIDILMGDNMRSKEVEEKRLAQKKYCDENQLPHFAPTDGICWRCHKQIYDAISLEKASNTLITGCPHCHYSYCD